VSILFTTSDFQNASLTPFAFYNLFDVATGQQIGSNNDPTGDNTNGRVTVLFRCNSARSADLEWSNV
jgi:hypothetical protein